MKKCKNGIDAKVMELFSDPFPFNDFFLYVSNNVTLEQTIGVLGILSPAFFEADGCIFWENIESIGYKEGRKGFIANKRLDKERYFNLFCVEDFFQKYEEVNNLEETEEEGGIKYKELKIIFARQIEKYWRLSLRDCYPEKKFEFEISGNGIWPEDGVCLTFWQVNE
ncbi:hypothetical protein [Komagataeibacter diospyri]|uniref:hypothetical protein n=1 Tax=Komagataeibacter diospyri TaxID=1932662 RepID=UPI0037579959